jgi:hypothetical protein
MISRGAKGRKQSYTRLRVMVIAVTTNHIPYLCDHRLRGVVPSYQAGEIMTEIEELEARLKEATILEQQTAETAARAVSEAVRAKHRRLRA